MFGWMTKTTSPIFGCFCNLRHFPVTKASRGTPASSVSTTGQPTSVDMSISCAAVTKLSCLLVLSCRRGPCQVAMTALV
ncbi:hypothetical protein T11_5295 [Trichinella zimbabwensis]|uniref:Uncharacterized protein n=1 Tax=Trichinella zimbabwensis TaxID=268475 RepID=A0A0V1GT71_9BILA|nr:hypothetical protein T11_5060 [Trichinella zimbabwensis]KRZ01389.1 hypothetical protein T11_5295 [Trichinella zimbabwensis]